MIATYFPSHINYTLIKLPLNLTYGTLIRDNVTFDGALGYLQRGEIDLVMASYVPTPERVAHFHLSQPL